MNQAAIELARILLEFEIKKQREAKAASQAITAAQNTNQAQQQAQPEVTHTEKLIGKAHDPTPSRRN